MIFRLSGDGFGSTVERAEIHRLTGLLAARLSQSGHGECDGDEFGEGQCRLFMFGDDPDAMYDSIASVLAESAIVRGGTVELRAVAGGKPYRSIIL